MANFVTGECVVGAVKGFAAVQNGDYTNYSVAVVAREYQDKYQTIQQDVVEVEIPKQRAEEIRAFVEKHQGQMVQVPFFSNVLSGQRNGKVWAFNKRVLARDSQINVLNGK